MADVTLAVIAEKVKNLEKGMIELRKDLKEHMKDNEEDFENLGKKLEDVATVQGRVEMMFTNLVETNKRMDKRIEDIAAAAGKDQGWRALIIDIIKAVVLILGFFATGKFIQ
jgi:predicted transcriptional regulator